MSLASNLWLETDTNILLRKAHSALQKYDTHAVVANELVTRKQKVVIVTPRKKKLLWRGRNPTQMWRQVRLTISSSSKLLTSNCLPSTPKARHEAPHILL